MRDIVRHKARSAMTLLGVFGCMLLIVGGLGMRDTMQGFIDSIDTTNNYSTKLTLSEGADLKSAEELCERFGADRQGTIGISRDGDSLILDIYGINNGKIRFFDAKNKEITLGDDGVYLCLRQKNTASVGDTVDFSPYGSNKTYSVRVAGYYRSAVSDGFAMTEEYAKKIGLDYRVTSLYTDVPSENIGDNALISGKQSKSAVMDSYDTFLELMNLMVGILIVAAAVLGAVVLYNLGIMSYVERKRELATLKVLGFGDRKIAHILISQNIWLTALGALFGLPGGVGVLYLLIKALCSEYELRLCVSLPTYFISILLVFGVSLSVGAAVARKNKKIDMVEALKTSE